MYAQCEKITMGKGTYRRIGQGEETTRPSGGPAARGSAPDNSCSRGTSWRKKFRTICFRFRGLIPRTGRQDYVDQISHQALHQKLPYLPQRSAHSRYLEATAIDLHRMSRRLPRKHDRRLEDCRHRPTHDRWQLWFRDGDNGIPQYPFGEWHARECLWDIDALGPVPKAKHVARC